MNIFLDTNVFWKDPFLNKGKKAILLRLAKHEDVKLFINETVYEETLRGHKKFLDKEIKSIADSIQKIRSFLDARRDKFEAEIKIENLINDFHIHFNELQSEEQLKLIDYDSDVLGYIVEMDAYEKAPFIQKQEVVDKKGEKISFSKKEIRDAIIWYSYKVFIEKNDLENCHFISNNAKDFGAEGSKKTPKEQPYDLHPSISKDMNVTAYKTIHDFLTYNDDKVKELFKNKDFHSKILSEDLIEQIEDELKNGLAEDLVRKFLIEQISEETESFLAGMEPEDIHEDYFMGGYVSPSMYGNITGIRFQEVNVYGDMITVAVDIDIEVDVEIFLYNPVHDSREDKFQHQATDTVKIEESVVFLIPTVRENELDIENFSFREYIEGTEPENLNIEFISSTNIDHNSMFPEDEEYESPNLTREKESDCPGCGGPIHVDENAMTGFCEKCSVDK